MPHLTKEEIQTLKAKILSLSEFALKQAFNSLIQYCGFRSHISSETLKETIEDASKLTKYNKEISDKT